MGVVRRVESLLSWGAVLLVCVAGALPGRAQNQPASQPAPDEPLRAEIRGVQAIYNPNQPMRVRFALINRSDTTVEIPLAYLPEAKDAIVLPSELIIGSSDEPALYVTYKDEKPVAIRGNPSPPQEPASALLRLAAHGSVGAEVDLRELYRRIRYRGIYRLEWRPLGGRLGTASVRFRVEPPQDAVISTDYGNIAFSLMYDKAPLNVENFLELAREGFYDRKKLHRIIAGYLIQGGCPHGDGTGLRPDGKLIPAEFHPTPFKLGTLAMARKPNDPNSASCQFFISLVRAEELDEQYTVIGQAQDEESLRTLQQLAALPTDQKHRPLQPLLIRSVSLMDTETRQRADQLETPRP
jgi:cyclophilin family peptidyl-prolyl cis-trans isomerase